MSSVRIGVTYTSTTKLHGSIELCLPACPGTSRQKIPRTCCGSRSAGPDVVVGVCRRCASNRTPRERAKMGAGPMMQAAALRRRARRCQTIHSRAIRCRGPCAIARAAHLERDVALGKLRVTLGRARDAPSTPQFTRPVHMQPDVQYVGESAGTSRQPRSPGPA